MEMPSVGISGRLGQAQIGVTFEQPGQGDAHLQPSERRTNAEMDARPESSHSS